MEFFIYAPLMAIPLVIGGLSHIVYSLVIKKKNNIAVKEVQEIVSTMKEQVTNTCDKNNEFLTMYKI